MLQKSRQEAVDGESERARRVRPRVRVLKRDLASAEAFESLIRERDPIDIVREVERRVAAIPDVLNMDRPATLPHVGVEGRADASAAQGIAHLRPKNPGEHIARQQKPDGPVESTPRRQR